MTGPWRTPRGSIAFTSVMGLVLLSLIALSLLPAGPSGRAGGGVPAVAQASVPAQAVAPASVPAPAVAPASVPGPVWSPGGGDIDLSSLPPQAGGVREHHVLSLWPPLRGERQSEVAHLALLPSPGAGTDPLRDPQQFGQRATGSRSPPPAQR
ncbi:hypothetical protein [Nonomuraea sp. NPDC050783]|uniref:hypothetical protein n=1 Tax=Nonomuraea sp. NPDC050783 TaxID=3154634 RepID=UPI00346701B9